MSGHPGHKSAAAAEVCDLWRCISVVCFCLNKYVFQPLEIELFWSRNVEALPATDRRNKTGCDKKPDGPVCEVFGLLAAADQLHDRIKHLVVAFSAVILLFQNEHEMMTEARLHHHPVDSAGEVDIGRQEHYIFSCSGNRR